MPKKLAGICLVLVLVLGGRAEAQLAPMQILPAFPSTADQLAITVEGLTTNCTGPPIFSAPVIAQQAIRLDAWNPDGTHTCNPLRWGQSFSVGPLPEGTYQVTATIDGAPYALKTIDVVTPSPYSSLSVASRFFITAIRSPSIPAYAVQLSAEAGYFWFFASSNPEVTVKILDGRPLNGHYWLFLSFQTSLAATVTIDDNAACVNQAVPPCVPSKVYNKPAGAVLSIVDTRAFPATY